MTIVSGVALIVSIVLAAMMIIHYTLLYCRIKKNYLKNADMKALNDCIAQLMQSNSFDTRKRISRTRNGKMQQYMRSELHIADWENMILLQKKLRKAKKIIKDHEH